VVAVAVVVGLGQTQREQTEATVVLECQMTLLALQFLMLVVGVEVARTLIRRELPQQVVETAPIQRHKAVMEQPILGAVVAVLVITSLQPQLGAAATAATA
jgi:uncharacterized metal-binding protein